VLNAGVDRSNTNHHNEEIGHVMPTRDVALLAARPDVTVAVGVALCVLVVAIAAVFIWHSSRHVNCTVGRLKTTPLTDAPPPATVVVARTGNNNSAKATPTSGAILVPASSVSRVHGLQLGPPSEPRVVIGRSASRDCTCARNDVTSAFTALHVSLNRLPVGDLLGPTNYIPYRLKQSYC